MRASSTDGVELEVHDLGGDGPPLLIAHATGMCAGAYLPLAAGLRSSFHVWALDFRAHGRSSTPADEDLAWPGMIDDVLTAVDALGGGPVAAIGHSMGGACLMGAELRRPGTVTRAFLFEPIIVPPGFDRPGANPMADAARRRRPGFPSRPEALARYASRPPLGTWRADALHAYVEHGFTDQADGTVALSCTPEHEARVFEGTGKPLISDMGAVATPVVVAYGARDQGPSPAAFAPLVADALPHGEGRRYAHLDHFGPFQDPDTLSADAVAFLAG
ncbi:MAG: alpha/beta fold hydrolase [Actinobacteria bacterium]|nr:alpha/beta fold hydrolase [Actinomycetota bacterium]